MVAGCEASLVLTIDAGGSGVKASVLCAREWRLLSTARRAYQVSYPAPQQAEFSPETWWTVMMEAAAEAVRRAGAVPSRYRAVTCTAMRIPFVLLDARGAPVTPGVLNLDGRGQPYVQQVREALGGDALYALTGHWPATPLGLPKLLWFKHRRPELWARVRHILQMHDWMLYELCGVMASEPSSASMSQLLDVTQRRWATALLEAVGIDPDLLPPLRDAGTQLGGLKPAVARALGLLAGTPVHVGGGDTHLGCLGVDGVEAGAVVIVAGSTTPIQLTVAAPRCDSEARPWVSAHVWPGRWAVEMNVGVTGLLYTWLRDLCYSLAPAGQERGYAALDALAGAAPPGAHDLLVTGPNPRWSEDAWERMPPMTVFGLTPAHSAGDVARAVLEGACYGVRGNLEQLETLNGGAFARVLVTGGASQSALWMQLLADVLGTEIEAPRVTEAAARAGALLVTKDDAAPPAPPLPTTLYRPDPAGRAAYHTGYRRYLDVYHSLSRAFGGVAH